MDRIAIMGLGLMGGSLGLVLKKRSAAAKIHIYARREETRQTALALGIADAVFADPVEAVRDADLIVYCTPILTIPKLVADSRAGFKPGAILTDVGSTKAELAMHIREALGDAPVVFVGSHPVAGSEQTGVEAAREDLYDGALVVVTPEDGQSPEAVEQVSAFWTGVGAWVRVISAREHDQVMARTSHLPHLLASLLATTTGRDGAAKEVGPYCGTGFRDTSRVADGSPDVWHDIVSTNAPAIAEELRQLRDQLDQLIGWTDASEFGRIKEFLAAGRDCRRALMAESPVE